METYGCVSECCQLSQGTYKLNKHWTTCSVFHYFAGLCAIQHCCYFNIYTFKDKNHTENNNYLLRRTNLQAIQYMNARFIKSYG